MHYDVIIVGGGPAGACAAALLGRAGLRALVLEEKRMPRHKVCGEFITSECIPSLDRLDVTDRLRKAGAQSLTRLRLVASNGRIAEIKMSEMSRLGQTALSLSRAKLDNILLERARESGAQCLEGFAVKRCIYEDGTPVGVQAMNLADGKEAQFNGSLIIDASGRNSRLMVSKEERMGGKRGSRLYALKVHLEQVSEITDQVELYFFQHGYGGLSRIEDGLVNLCFITDEGSIKEANGDHDMIVRRTIMQNPLACERLAEARVADRWLSAGPLSFGTRRLSHLGVLALGDASGMIDPFTGTGIQIAMRTGEMAADAVIEFAGDLSDTKSIDPQRRAFLERVIASYQARYEREFGKRMKVAGILRSAAFSPAMANYLATLLGAAPWIARRVLRATRQSG